MTDSIEHPFWQAFRGTFYGVLRWPQLDTLWETLRGDAAANWYIYAIGTEPPIATVSVTRPSANSMRCRPGVRTGQRARMRRASAPVMPRAS